MAQPSKGGSKGGSRAGSRAGKQASAADEPAFCRRIRAFRGDQELVRHARLTDHACLRNLGCGPPICGQPPPATVAVTATTL